MKSTLFSGAALLALALPAVAQGPGGGAGGFQMPPEIQKKIEAWRKWNDNHKHIGELGHTMRGIAEANKDPKTALKKDQAKKILAAIKPWQTKQVMTNDQALTVNKQISGVLTVPQIKVLATVPQGFGGRGGGGGRMGGGPGGGGPGGGRPGGPGGPGGGRPGGGMGNFTIPDPKDFNPLNPASFPGDKNSPFMQRRIKDFNDQIADLERRAK